MCLSGRVNPEPTRVFDWTVDECVWLDVYALNRCSLLSGQGQVRLDGLAILEATRVLD